ncbi:MAG TPA: Ig-like domain-containing protein, partial [Longimicrobiaceae bacterium]|nr:Ig-like domain-containing protein [Longimicrobiaceae bacterium]
MKRILPVLLALLALAGLSACKDTSGPDGPALSQLTISPSPLYLGVGDTMHLTAVGTKASDDSRVEVSPEYKSSNPSVASVDASGLVTGKAVGSATITAKAGGQSQTVQVSILDSGSFRTFNVNAKDTNADQCDIPINHAARLVATSAHAQVYEDNTNPSGGFSAAEYQAILNEFESIVWPTDSLNFGNPSDLDGNHKVIILYTRAVNDLTPPGADFVVGGFYYGRDLFPRAEANGLQACPTSNLAEMFYMLVPDPTGASNGHVRTKDYVREGTVGTIAHELQHLINASRRLYIHDADFEDVWLDEGISHIAEELNFFAARGLGPRQNLGQSQVFATQAQVNTFVEFEAQNFGRFAEYLSAPSANAPYADGDDLATRGATWSFLRYTADRRAGNDQQYWFALVNTKNQGLANLQAVLGTDPVLWARDWTVANYTDDVVPTPAVFQQPSWQFRDIYSNPGFGGYPLSVTSLGNTSYNFAIQAGSAAYLKFGVATGQQADLRFIQAGSGSVAGTCAVQNLAVGGSVQVILGAAGAALCFPGPGEYVAIPFHASNTLDQNFNLAVTASNVVTPVGPPNPNKIPSRLFSLDGRPLTNG